MKYRLPELEVPPDDPFLHDALNRKPLVEFLANLIGKLEGPFVLALDSPWGTGKTTIVKMLKAKLATEKFQCVYFNAWKVDYVTDPLVALVSALDGIHLADAGAESAFRGHLKTAKKITSAVAKRAVVAGVKAATFGVLEIEKDFEGVAADAAGEVAGNLVDAFQKEKQALEKFRSEVDKAVKQLRAAGKNGWRQLPWPLGDNYPGRWKTGNEWVSGSFWLSGIRSPLKMAIWQAKRVRP